MNVIKITGLGAKKQTISKKSSGINGLTAPYHFEKILSVYHIFRNVCACRSNWITQISGLVLSPFWNKNSSNKAGTQMAEGELWPGICTRGRKLNQPTFPHTKKRHFPHLQFPVGDAPNNNKRKWSQVAPGDV